MIVAKRKRSMAILLLISMMFSLLTPAAMAQEGQAVDYSKIPKLLITELAPDTTNSTGSTDGYEFIEIYNNSSDPVNLLDYKLVYENNSKLTDWNLAADLASAMIPSKGTIVLWVMNGTNGLNEGFGADKFNEVFSTQLVEGVNLFRTAEVAGMANTGPRSLAIKDKFGHTIVSAGYAKEEKPLVNKGLRYKYPVDGGTAMKLYSVSESAATPGTVEAVQVPERTADEILPPQPPVVEGLKLGHLPLTEASREQDATVVASVYGSGDTVTSSVYYKVNTELKFKELTMVSVSDTVYMAAIPKEQLKAHELHYYVQAQNLATGETAKTDVYTVPIKGGYVDPTKVPTLLITELLPNSINVGGSDGYEFIELYNNTTADMNLKDYKLYYRYTDSGKEADVVWPTDREDMIIGAGKTLVFWVINSKNTTKTVADFNSVFGTQLIENVDIVKVYSDGMANGSRRGMAIGTNTHKDITTAYYDGGIAGETAEQASIYYAYPENGATEMIKYSAGVKKPTPGKLEVLQLPPAPRTQAPDQMMPVVTDLTGAETIDQANNLNIRLDAQDDQGVKSVEFYYKTDRDLAYTKRYLNESYDDLMYHYTIYSPDMIGRAYVEYYAVVSDGTHELKTEVTKVNITGQAHPAELRMNVKDGDMIAGKKQLKGTAEQEHAEALSLKIDGMIRQDTYRALEQDAYFVFEVTGVNYYFKNAVTMGTDILHTFLDPITTYTTLSYPIEANRLVSGSNKIAIRAGSKSGPFDDRVEENKDDFEIRNIRLLLADGTEIVDPQYATRDQVYKMGDSAGRFEFIDFDLNIAEEQLKSKAYMWDTTAVADGEHVISLLDNKQKEISAKVIVDNTAPVIVPTVEEGQSYRGAFTLDATVTDAHAGVKELAVELDGNPIQLPYATSSGSLTAGEHVLKITAADTVGNRAEKTVSFLVPNENPLLPELVAPLNGSTVGGASASLQVKVQDPTEDEMSVSFYKGFKIDANSPAGFAAFKNAADVEPPKVAVPANEQAFSEEDYAKIGAVDGNYLIEDSMEQFPYHRFTIELDDSVSTNDQVEIKWQGKSLEGRKVSLYAWKSQTSQWVLLDQVIAGNEDFELTAAVAAGDYSSEAKVGEKRVINVMVQDQIPMTNDEYDFSFVWMSDTQYYSQSYPNIYGTMVNWIKDNQVEQKIKYVIHTGDLVDKAYDEAQWNVADASMKVLDDANIPYGVLAGNHDVGHQTNDYSEYWKYFGADRFANQPTYGGTYDNNRGHYDLISSNGNDFIIVYMGWGLADDEIEWMNQVVKQYPERKAILAFHEYLLVSGNRAPIADKVYEKVIVPNKNVIAALSGHYHDAELKVDAIDDDGDGVADRNVYQMLADYQGAEEGGQGYMRLLQFDMKNNKLHVKTYSPHMLNYNYYDPIANPGKDEFSLDLDLEGKLKRVATDYFGVKVLTDSKIGSVEQVKSGALASVVWSELKSEQYNQWYAVAEDAFSGRTVSDIWGFQTGKVSDGGNGNGNGNGSGDGSGNNGNVVTPPVTPPAPTESGNKLDKGRIAASLNSSGRYAVTGEELAAALKQATASGVDIVLQAAAGKPNEAAQLELSADGVRELVKAKAALRVTSPSGIVLSIPAAAWPSELGQANSFTINMNSSLDAAAKQALTRAVNRDAALMSRDVVIALELSMLLGQNTVQNVQFSKPIRVEYAMTAAEAGRINANYAGVYDLNRNDSEAAYMAGSITAGKVRFETAKLSRYSVMEYRKSFADMTNNWAQPYVERLVARHIVKGMDANHYGPTQRVTRADFAVMAMRALGIPLQQATVGFTDVAQGAYYANAVATASEWGLVQGNGGKFRPQDTITREEAAVILVRLVDLLGKNDVAGSSSTAAFADMKEISSWAKDAVQAAQALGLIQGKGNNRFDPKGTVTRAELAKMIDEAIRL